MTFPLTDLTERDFSRQVYELANLLSWRRYHTWRSKHSPAGYPDETLVRERVVWLELKRASGKLSPAQKEWLAALLQAGGEAYVVRPADLDDLAAVLHARAPRWNALAGGAPVRALVAYERLTARTRAEVGL